MHNIPNKVSRKFRCKKLKSNTNCNYRLLNFCIVNGYLMLNFKDFWRSIEYNYSIINTFILYPFETKKAATIKIAAFLKNVDTLIVLQF